MKFNRWALISALVVLGVGLSVWGFSWSRSARNRAGGTSSTNAQPAVKAAPLEVQESNLIAGLRDGKLYLLVDVFPQRTQLESVPEADARAVLTETALQLTRKYFAQEKYKGVSEANVDIIYVPGKNEYQRPDYSSMVKQGSLTLRRAADGTVAVVEENLRIRRSQA